MNTQQVKTDSGIVGHVEHLREIQSARLKHARDVLIWLPPSYQRNSRKRFPVVYIHDGQNLMNPATAFLGKDWQMDETVSRLIRQEKIEELILVGIYNTADREKEYTGSGEGKSYAAFIVDELKPFIDAKFRTRRDRRNTAVMGSSLGGLISFLMAWWYPSVFSMAGCLSPSFFWNEYSVLKQVQAHRGPRKRVRLYVDVGTKETLLREGYQLMVELLLQKGYRKSQDLEYHVARGADHDELSWGKRLWRPLVFFFGKINH